MTDTSDAGAENHCPFIKRCPMFPIFTSKSVLKVYQSLYCQGRFQGCKRYELASSGNMPPPELLPDGSTLSRRDGE